MVRYLSPQVAFAQKDVREYEMVGTTPIMKDKLNEYVEMFVFRPPGSVAGDGFRHPTLLWIHGGAAHPAGTHDCTELSNSELSKCMSSVLYVRRLG
eukprot:SAG11_NODE_341_length_10462_cov_49.272990_13_plen_96_part_00